MNCFKLIAKVLLLMVFVGLSRQARAAVKVVTTTAGLAALTKEVGKGLVDVQAMALWTQDPHFVDAKPSLALSLNRADLVVLVGLDLEVGWLPRLLVGARNPRVQTGARGYLDCSRFVRIRDVPASVDRSHGDIHPGGNPHYLSDPRQAQACARGIAERLAELDPAHRADYQRHLADFEARLTATRAGWERRLAPFKGAAVFGYHQTWSYVADWAGLVEVGFLEPKPGIPPTPAHVAELLALGRARGVRAILQEAYYPDATSKLLAAKIPVALVKVPGDVAFQNGQTYLEFAQNLVGALEQGLRGGGTSP